MFPTLHSFKFSFVRSVLTYVSMSMCIFCPLSFFIFYFSLYYLENGPVLYLSRIILW